MQRTFCLRYCIVTNHSDSTYHKNKTHKSIKTITDFKKIHNPNDPPVRLNNASAETLNESLKGNLKPTQLYFTPLLHPKISTQMYILTEGLGDVYSYAECFHGHFHNKPNLMKS